MMTRQRARTLVDSSTRTMYIRREISEETDLCDQFHANNGVKCGQTLPIKIKTEDEDETDNPLMVEDDSTSTNNEHPVSVVEHQSLDQSDLRTENISPTVAESEDFVVVKQEFADEDSLSSDGESHGQENIPIQDNIIIKTEHDEQTPPTCSRGEKPFVCKLCKASFSEFPHLFRHLETHRNFSAVSLFRNVAQQRTVKKSVPPSSRDCVSRSQSRNSPPSYASQSQNSPVQQASTSEMTNDTTLMTDLDTSDVQGSDSETVFPSGFSQLAQIVDKLHKRAFHCMQSETSLSAAGFEQHSGIRMKKVFTCEICNRSFGRNYHYKRHMTIHAKPQTFQCSQCDKRFKRRSHFDRHRCIRPYRCQMWKTHGW